MNYNKIYHFQVNNKVAYLYLSLSTHIHKHTHACVHAHTCTHTRTPLFIHLPVVGQLDLIVLMAIVVGATVHIYVLIFGSTFLVVWMDTQECGCWSHSFLQCLTISILPYTVGGLHFSAFSPTSFCFYIRAILYYR